MSKILCNTKGCIHSHQYYFDGKWICESYKAPALRRRPLTDYEKLKLSWYKNEKSWIENIQDRHIERDRNGTKVTVSQGRVIPQQPKQYWTGKPKQVQ
jgi:hypothetical protein